VTDPNPSPAPVVERNRVYSLDVLRGLALLGILIMNIQTFAMPEAAYFNPTAYGSLNGAHFFVWLFGRLLADQKFMTVFSMLFGAGILLMADRAEARTGRSAGLHYRRMAWLILFGLLHAHLFWYGDILYLYGVCGLVVYLFRKLRPRVLITVGLASLVIGSSLFLFIGLSMPYWPEVALEDVRNDLSPTPEIIQDQLEIYRGGWIRQMEHRVPAALEFELFVIFVWGLWRAGGLMLIGMGLFKLGIFSNSRSAGFYRALIAAAILIGMPIILFGVSRNFASGWNPLYYFFIGGQYNYWASLLVSMGWVGLAMLMCRSEMMRPFTDRLAAVGRTALSNYLLQTLICTTIFYGHGLGLVGRVERVGQISLVAAIWIVQLWISPLWLRRFRFGPFEWLWRSLTYLKRQPLRGSAAR
jgi:uncharacterized protein